MSDIDKIETEQKKLWQAFDESEQTLVSVSCLRDTAGFH